MVAQHGVYAVGRGGFSQFGEQFFHIFTSLVIVAAQQEQVGTEVAQGTHEAVQMFPFEFAWIVCVRNKSDAETVKSFRHLGVFERVAFRPSYARVAAQ